MNIAIYNPYTLWSPHFETVLEIIDRHIAAGDHVTYLTCEGELPTCMANPDHKKSSCLRCVDRRNQGLKLVDRPIEVKSLVRHTQPESERLRVEFADEEELKLYSIDNGNFDIGWGVLSSLISYTQLTHPNLPQNKEVIARLVEASARVYWGMLDYVQSSKPDAVYFFNGRFAEARGVLRACQKQGVQCFAHERAYDRLHMYEITVNTLPHDYEYLLKEVRKAWNTSILSYEEKISIGSSFFEERVANKDAWSITKEQAKGTLPIGFDTSAQNIVIFQSSEDEFAAIGDEWKNPVYENQLAGIARIKRDIKQGKQQGNIPQSMRLYVRMHPLLKSYPIAEVQPFYELHDEDCCIIRPEDPVHSYTLMKFANRVLVFGSTVGIEAPYYGVPSILAGKALYIGLGSTYDANSHEEVMNYLTQEKLQPLDKAGCYMFGFYYKTFGIPYRNFQATGLYAGLYKGNKIVQSVETKIKSRIIQLLDK